MSGNRCIAGLLLLLASSAQANEADDTIHRLVDEAHAYAVARSPAGLSRTLFEIAKVLPNAGNDGLAAVNELSRYLDSATVAPGQDAALPAAPTPAAPLSPPIESQPAETSEPALRESGAEAQQPPPVAAQAPDLPASALPALALPPPALPAPASPVPTLPAPALPTSVPAPSASAPSTPTPSAPAPVLPAPVLPAAAPPAPASPVLPAPASPVLALPEPAISTPVPASPAPAPSAPALPATAVTRQASPALLDLLRRQGAAALGNGDVSGARRFFQRGAEAGCAPCAEGMAQTFDAEQLGRIGAIGIRPDPAQAEAWRMRARQLMQTTKP